MNDLKELGKLNRRWFRGGCILSEVVRMKEAANRGKGKTLQISLIPLYCLYKENGASASGRVLAEVECLLKEAYVWRQLQDT